MSQVFTQPSMSLAQLFSSMPSVPLTQSAKNIVITGMSLDSRQIKTNELFIAVKGEGVDGHNYIEQAINAGAVAVISERIVESTFACPVIVMPEIKQQLSVLAGYFYQQPSKKLTVIGVTGTNGKTSCTQIISQWLTLIGKRCAVMGTLGTGIGEDIQASVNTTPDAISVQKLLWQWQQQAVDCVAMEVSSHGIDQGRVTGVEFATAVFTNLSRDHLDYHETMQHYAETKARLMQWPKLRAAVINSDDQYAPQMLKGIADDVKVYPFSLINRACDVFPEEVRFQRDGIRARINTPWGELQINSQLLGGFNLQNIMAALICLLELGEPLEALEWTAAAIKPIRGRMELIENKQDISVVVDYAHTPDALEQALTALRKHSGNKQLVCLFGCGGDRDQGKRALMAEVAVRCADRVWITSDNPRSENPERIIKQIQAGAGKAKQVSIEIDRAIAINKAIVTAEAGDVVLLAGKGHENYQLIAGKKYPFSDAEQAKLALEKRAA